MRAFFSLLVCIFCVHNAYPQSPDSDKAYEQLLTSLGKEDWAAADKTCLQLLESAANTDAMQRRQKVLRYMHIFATAGLLNEKKLTQQQALKKVAYLKGKEVIMPAHPFRRNCYVNCTQFAEEANTFFTGANNTAGTQIFAFEYVTIKSGIKETKEELEGKLIELSGVLSDVVVQGNILPRFKLTVRDGAYKVTDQ